VLLDDTRHVFGRNAGVPDVVGVDEDDRPLVVAARAGVAQHRVRRISAPLDLETERLKELAAALRAATVLAGGGAHEDLSKPCHATNSMPRQELFQARRRLQATGTRLQVFC
jgi:hypothetical protein